MDIIWSFGLKIINETVGPFQEEERQIGRFADGLRKCRLQPKLASSIQKLRVELHTPYGYCMPYIYEVTIVERAMSYFYIALARIRRHRLDATTTLEFCLVPIPQNNFGHQMGWQEWRRRLYWNEASAIVNFSKLIGLR